MVGSVSFNLINLGGIKLGTHISFSYSLGTHQSSEPALVAPADLPLPFHDLNATAHPMSLLSWHTSVSDFVGRDREMTLLSEWAEQGQRISTKLLIGVGGSGKSRLAAEFGVQLRANGWSAGFVNLAQNSTHRVSAHGCLFLIDYPEESREAVQVFLATLAKSEYPSKIRVLLVTRYPASYWEETFRSAKCHDIVDYEPIRLSVIDPERLYRAYTSSVEKASERLQTLPLPLSQEAFTAWTQSSPENTLPLFVIAAAAHAALNPQDSVVQYSGRQVAAALVDRELGRLEPISISLDLAKETLARLLALATIAGVLDGDALSRCTALRGIGLEGASDPVGVLRDSGILVDGKMDAPKPDIIGAALAAKTLAAAGSDAPEWVWFAIKCDAELESACARLSRIVHDERSISGNRESVVALLLIQAIAGRLERLMSLASYFGAPEMPYALSGVEEAVWGGLAELAPDLRLKAAALNNLAFCLLNRKQYGAAIPILRDALDIHAAHPDMFGNRAGYERGLALMNLGRTYADTGQYEIAIKVLQDAVRCFEPDAQSDGMRASASSSLSGTLDLLGRSLHRAGHKGGLKLLVRATEIAKALALQAPEKYEGDYVWRLVTLGSLRQAMGNLPGALTTFEAAISTARQLVNRQPGRHEDKLAKGLINKAAALAQTHAFEAAAQSIDEATEIYQILNATTEGLFVLELSVAIMNYLNIATASRNAQIVVSACTKFLQNFNANWGGLAEEDPPLSIYVAHALAKALNDRDGELQGFQELTNIASQFASVLGEVGDLSKIFGDARKFTYYPAPFSDWRKSPSTAESGHDRNIKLRAITDLWNDGRIDMTRPAQVLHSPMRETC